MSTRDPLDPDERDALEGLSRELDELRARHAGDPPVDLLRAAHADALPRELQDDISAHLHGSRWSRTLAESMEDAGGALTSADEDRLLRRVQDATRTDTDRRRTRMAWLALPAFAAIAIIVIGAAAWRIWSGRPDPEPASSAATTAQAPAPPVAPAFHIPLQKADVRLTPAALTWRVAGQGTFVNDVAPAMDAYRNGQYARANEAFSGLTARYPQSVEVFFYQGVSRLLLGDVLGASEALTRAEPVAEGSFVDDIAWYRAIADERMGDRAGARRRLDAICRGGGSRAAAACDAGKKIGEGDSRSR